MDKLDKRKRSWNMSRVKSKNTKPEILIRKELFSRGYRYRLHVNLEGKPDICFRSKKLLIFINGCFWHVHRCKESTFPRTNSRFWKEKLNKNKERDRKNYSSLRKKGWKILVIWECEIEKNLPRCVDKIEKT